MFGCSGLGGWRAHKADTPCCCWWRAFASGEQGAACPDPIPSVCAGVLCPASSHSPQNSGVDLPASPASADTGWQWVKGHVAHPSLPSWLSLVLAALTMLWALQCLSISTAVAKPTPASPNSPTCGQCHRLLCPSLSLGTGLCTHLPSSLKGHQEQSSRQRLTCCLIHLAHI